MQISRRAGLVALLVLAACGTPASQGDADPPADAAKVASAPSAQAARRVNPADTVLLSQALQRAAELPRLRGILVSQDGQIVLERYTGGAAADRTTNIKSASKSVLSALVGIAIAEGHIRGIDQPISDFFPAYFARQDVDPRKRQITVGNLLSMQSGLESTSFNEYGAWVSSPNWVNAALEQPVVDPPGGRMLYSTGSTHLLSAILTRATGRSTWQYANEKLAEPLGFRIRPWQRDPQGIFFGGNDMYLTPRQMLRLGQLWLDEGRVGDRQVVPAAWVRESVRQRTSSPWNGHGYGLGWWTRTSRSHAVHFAWGYGGQYVFVVPDLRMVAVFTSQSDGPRDVGHLPAIHRIVDETLVPGAAARLNSRE
ncbi:serine hydrolase [Longimicrobium sp.]|uniref:serine hydrolase domain-containing protein n=1 Tax=Longimicrobium sp. TaxID=2029185 RepID=UPI002E36D1A3|nr:serine hydrolase [Longimicrobium sp.]HEX6039757.1 serine hydrolase [Longimicrobium sp.]